MPNLEGFLFPATYEFTEDTKSPRARRGPARGLRPRLGRRRPGVRQVEEPDRLRRPHHRLDDREGGAGAEGAPARLRRHLQPPEARDDARDRRDDPLRARHPADESIRESQLADPRPVQHPHTRGPAADADREPGPRLDPGGGQPGERRLPLLRPQRRTARATSSRRARRSTRPASPGPDADGRDAPRRPHRAPRLALALAADAERRVRRRSASTGRTSRSRSSRTRLEEGMAGLAALGFAGANVTIPHKTAAVAFCDELDDVRRAGGLGEHDRRPRRPAARLDTDGLARHGRSTPAGRRVLLLGAGGAAQAVASALADARRGDALPSRHAGRSRRTPCRAPDRLPRRRRPLGGRWPPQAGEATLLVNATPVRDEPLVEPRAGPGGRRPRLPRRTASRPRSSARRRAAGCAVVLDGLEVLVRQGAASFERWTGGPAPVDVMRAAATLSLVTLTLTTAGESHGPALVAIVTGLPAGLVLDRDAIDADLRAPPAGLRAQPAPADRDGRGRGARRAPARADARDAARARRPEPRPQELDVGDEPLAARGRAAGQGQGAGHAAAARARRPRRRHEVRPRRRARRARARERAAHGGDRRGGRVAKALLARDRDRGRGSC